MTAHQNWIAAESLAATPELLAFCEAQRVYVDSGEGLANVERLAKALVTAAQRVRLSAERILQALHIAGCYRFLNPSPAEERLRSDRYHRTLGYLWKAYFGSDSRPADGRIDSRET